MGREPFYVVGPTGGGKSAVALTLAQRWDGEIINADAFQVYRDMPLVTAGPTDAERAVVPHHLYAAVPLTEDYNVARYAREAQRVITEVQSRDHLPIVVGGSGLYIKALTHGLGDSPPADPSLRSALASMPLAQQVCWLRHIDPTGAEQTNLRNPRYVSRALEITLLSGIPMSVVKQRWATDGPSQPCGILLQWDRAELYQRINERVLAMVDCGLVAEIQALPQTISETARKAIGVREIQAYLEGAVTLDDAILQIQQASRRYAKRQLSWFKRESAFVPTHPDSAAIPDPRMDPNP